MSEKNIVYLWETCGLSYDTIALQCKLSVDQVKAIIHKPKPYPLAYVPRQRYSGWVNGK
jgi:hypothetical protein